MLEVYEEELSRAREALESGNFEVCFVHLERAHVLSQRMTGRHTHVHWLMLVAGWRRGDWREVVGQVPRMLASMLFSRLWVPRGNTGRARVSAFKPMPVPEDLRDLVAKIDARVLVATALAALCAVHGDAQALNLASTQLPQADGGSTTAFYPTSASESAITMGPFQLSWASDAQPERGNGRLVVISHGSGGSPWVHVDLARTLVLRGFVVAIPQHSGDNHLDSSSPGPQSWVKRPREVSGAIDLIANDLRLSPILSLDAVGIFGGSAGGHTALSLAGGEWSPARFRDHCMQHIEEDFSSCVGFTTLLRGDWLDGFKVWLAKGIISLRFSDDTVQRHFDPRVKASVAMVPFAADFDPRSLAEPRVPLGLVVAARDVNQNPAFHAEAVRKVCEPRCQLILNLQEAGHGAMLSPLPPLEKGSIADHLLSDPPAFDRADTLPRLNGRIAEFFEKALPGQ